MLHFGNGCEARAHADACLVGGEHRHLQRLHLPEDGIDLRVRHVVVNGLDVGEEIQTGLVEFRSNLTEAIQRQRHAPFP